MKRLLGSDIAGSYVFNPSAKTITFSGISLQANQFLLITNMTDNIIIFNFADPLTGGTFSNNVLTLTYDTTGMSSSDNLQIFIDVPDTTEDTIAYLNKILKVLESNQIVDNKQRQRVVVEAIGTNNAPASTEINATLPVTVSGTTSLTSGGQGPTLNAPTLATTIYQPIWEGPVDQRWRVAEDSHISYQMGIRSNLSFS